MRKLLWVVFFAMLYNTTIGQNKKIFSVRGQLLSQSYAYSDKGLLSTSRKIEGGIITIEENGQIIDQVKTNKVGGFDIRLAKNHNYVIRCSYLEFVPKKFTINTYNVPDKVYNVEWPYIEVSLLERVKGVDFSLLDNPIGKIAYLKRKKAFNYDKKYTKSIQEKLSALLASSSKAKQQKINVYLKIIESNDENKIIVDSLVNKLDAVNQKMKLATIDLEKNEIELKLKKKVLKSIKDSILLTNYLLDNSVVKIDSIKKIMKKSRIEVSVLKTELSNQKILFDKTASLMSKEQVIADSLKKQNKIIASIKEEPIVIKKIKPIIKQTDKGKSSLMLTGFLSIILLLLVIIVVLYKGKKKAEAELLSLK